jgi:hypothetical protein
VKDGNEYVLNATQAVDHQRRRGGTSTRVLAMTTPARARGACLFCGGKRANSGFEFGMRNAKLGIAARPRRDDLQQLRIPAPTGLNAREGMGFITPEDF